MWPLTLQEADTCGLVLGIGGVLLGVSQHLGEGNPHVLLGGRQMEVPGAQCANNHSPMPCSDEI